MEANVALPNLVGGVSQQPAPERTPNSFESVDNCWSGLVEGLARRPGSELLATLPLDFDGEVFPCETVVLHPVDLGPGSRYLLAFAPRSPGAFTTGNTYQDNLYAYTERGVQVPVQALTATERTYLETRRSNKLYLRFSESIGWSWVAGADMTYDGRTEYETSPVGFGRSYDYTLDSDGINGAGNVGCYTFNPTTVGQRKNFAVYVKAQPGRTLPDTVRARVSFGLNTYYSEYVLQDGAYVHSTDPDPSRCVGQVREAPNGWQRLEITVSPLPADAITACSLQFLDAGTADTHVRMASAFLDEDTNVRLANFPPYVTGPLHEAIKMTTGGTNVFLLNTTLDTAQGSATAPDTEWGPTEDEAMVYCRQSTYDAGFRLSVTTNATGGTASADLAVKTQYGPNNPPDDNDDGVYANATTVFEPSSEDVIEALYSDLVTAFGTNVSAARKGSVMWFRTALNTTSINQLTASDSLGDTALVAIHGRVEDVTDLPRIAYNDFVVEVRPSGAASGYWVRFEGDTGTPLVMERGRWVECAEPGVLTELDPDTMPHLISLEQDDAAGSVTGVPYGPYFDVAPAAWEARAVGDDTTNPFPEWTGSPISDLTFYQGRMVLVSGPHVTTSRSNDLFDLFRSTVQSVPASDPVQFTVEHPRPVDIRWAAALDERMLIGGTNAVFVVRSDGPLGPDTVSVTPLGDMDSYRIEPVLGGAGLLVAGPSNGWSKVYEMYPLDSRDRFGTRQATAQCPRFLPEVLGLSTSQAEGCAVARTAEGLFVYRMEPVGDRVLAGWSRWPGSYLAAHWMQSSLYAVVSRSGSALLERTDLPLDPSDPCLDARCVPSESTVVPGFTDLTLPYSVPAGLAVLSGGVWCDHQVVSDTVVRVAGSGPFVAGVRYDSSVGLTRPYLRNQDQGGGTAVIEEVALIQALRLDVADSQHLAVSLAGWAAFEVDYTLPQLGGPVLGQPIPTDGLLSLPMGYPADAATVVVHSDSPFFFRLQVIEWQLLLNTRRRSIPA